MSRQKKLFAVLAAIFVMLLIWVSYDISRRTTFPGASPQLREQLMQDPPRSDTVDGDTTHAPRPKSEMP